MVSNTETTDGNAKAVSNEVASAATEKGEPAQASCETTPLPAASQTMEPPVTDSTANAGSGDAALVAAGSEDDMLARFLDQRAKSKRKTMIRRLIIVGAISLVALAALLFFLLGNRTEEPKTTGTSTYTETVAKGNLDLTIEGSGTLSANGSTNVSAAVTGTVKEVLVSLGQEVNEGDVLFTIDSESVYENIETALETLNDAAESLNEAQNSATYSTASYSPTQVTGTATTTGKYARSATLAPAVLTATFKPATIGKTSARSSNASESSTSELPGESGTEGASGDSGTQDAAGQESAEEPAGASNPGDPSSNQGSDGPSKPSNDSTSASKPDSSESASSSSVSESSTSELPGESGTEGASADSGAQDAAGQENAEEPAGASSPGDPSSNQGSDGSSKPSNDSTSDSSGQSKSQSGQSGNSVSQAQKAYEKAQKAYEDALAKLDALTVKAPTGGVITALNVTAGDSVGSGSGSGSGGSNSGGSSSSALTISNHSSMTMVVSVSAYDINSIAVGQKASVSVTAIDQTTEGTVSSIAAKASSSGSSSSIAYYDVTIVLPSPTQEMREGMNATATITYESHEDALLVPSGAVNIDPQGNATVEVQRFGDSTETVSVRVLATDGTTSAVTGDLSEGDTLVVTYRVTSSGSSSSANNLNQDIGSLFGGNGGSGPNGGRQGGGSGGDRPNGSSGGPGGSGGGSSRPTRA